LHLKFHFLSPFFSRRLRLGQKEQRSSPLPGYRFLATVRLGGACSFFRTIGCPILPFMPLLVTEAAIVFYEVAFPELSLDALMARENYILYAAACPMLTVCSGDWIHAPTVLLQSAL
ncbi:hypothetical protein NDU88_001129, partial [Pleurodeles waltl]